MVEITAFYDYYAAGNLQFQIDYGSLMVYVKMICFTVHPSTSSVEIKGK